MKKPNRKYESKAKLRLLAFLLFSILIYLIYYQLWHHSEQVNGKIYVLNKSLNGHLSDVWTVKFSPDGNSIASGSVDSTVKIWNKKDGKIILNLKQPNGITSLDFSPDGKTLASGSFDKTVRIWSLKDGNLLKTITDHSEAVVAIAFSQEITRKRSGSFYSPMPIGRSFKNRTPYTFFLIRL